MVDETQGIEDTEEEDRRSHGVIATVLLVILVIIIILFLWRSCDDGSNGGASSSGDKTIESVEPGEIVEGSVTIWVKPGESVDEILARNGLGEATASDMEEGTYVVAVGDADLESLVDQLKADPGLYDAGFLYSED